MDERDPYEELMREVARSGARNGSAGVDSRVTSVPRPEPRRVPALDVGTAAGQSAAGTTTGSDQPDPVARPSAAPDSGSWGIPLDLLSLLRLLARQWRVTGPAVLVTLLGVFVALQHASPSYQATGAVALLSPPQPPEAMAAPGQAPPPDVGENPFVRYDDLSIMADILARVVSGESARSELLAQGVAEYEVVANRYQRGPVVEVTGEGSSEAAAIGSAEAALAEVDVVLEEVQLSQGADPEYFIRTAPLEPPSKATPQYGSTVRVGVATLVVGALITLGVAVLAETLARRRLALPPVAGDEEWRALHRSLIDSHVGGDPARRMTPADDRRP